MQDKIEHNPNAENNAFKEMVEKETTNNSTLTLLVSALNKFKTNKRLNEFKPLVEGLKTISDDLLKN